ncbi:exo-beta-1,3-glucanase [Mycena floridula]|nr:exo-beta-1,3-glucanase [Mycena floridula]
MVSFTAIICCLSLIVSTLAFTPGFPYPTSKVRGVNLGGWLVLEPWLCPSFFSATGNTDIVDEWTFGLYQSKSVATAALEAHWDSWIVEQDFKDIKAAGLNHVRIPIGYWAFEVGPGEPYIQGQLPYLKQAVVWAKKYGIKVIIDLHGVPGSQNGFDNSGHRMNYPTWHSNTTNVARSNKIIKTLANMFPQSSDVPIIAPLNEPAGFYGESVMKVVRQYWKDSYGNIRFPLGTKKQSNTVVLIHDAFLKGSVWKGFMPYPQYEGVALDSHIYSMFTSKGNQMTESQHIKEMCNQGPNITSSGLWTIVGEWTPATNDCAKYLNGLGVGARYDGTMSGSTRVGSCQGVSGKASTFTPAYKTLLAKMWSAQVFTYEKYGLGWIQWTWKAEQADDWSYQAGLKAGFISQDPTKLLYPNICK